MPRLDTYHEVVKEALITDGWTITHDPLTLLSKAEGGLATDLGAEKIITAEKGLQKIAVEVKSFLVPSAIHEFIKSTGQYRAYTGAILLKKRNRVMYLAMPTYVWQKLENKKIIQFMVKDAQMRLILYDPQLKIIDEWKE
jgi:XisH protein